MNPTGQKPNSAILSGSLGELPFRLSSGLRPRIQARRTEERPHAQPVGCFARSGSEVLHPAQELNLQQARRGSRGYPGQYLSRKPSRQLGAQVPLAEFFTSLGEPSITLLRHSLPPVAAYPVKTRNPKGRSVAQQCGVLVALKARSEVLCCQSSLVDQFFPISTIIAPKQQAAAPLRTRVRSSEL